MDSTMFLNWIISMMMKKIVIPSDYHAQCKAVRSIYNDDVTGLVDSLTDYYVNSASVDFRFETENDNLTNKFNNWLETINIGFDGQVPTGIKALEKEYHKERVKYSSFPILKLHKWERVGDLVLPTKMYFLDGESIYAQDKDDKGSKVNLVNYDYFVGQGRNDKNKLVSNKNVDYIFTKPFARWKDEYPIPLQIKNGTYHNYKIIYSLKDKQTEILDQILAYLMHIKKGSPELFMKGKVVTQGDLDNAITQMQDIMNEMKTTSVGSKQIQTPIRATDFTEEIKHLIPDIGAMFKEELFSVAEKNILSAQGFIDIAEAVSSNRKESVLNPTVFLLGVKAGVGDFEQILYEIYLRIKIRNATNIKYMSTKTLITHSPITVMVNKDLRNFFRQQYDKGNISRRTSVEILGQNFENEVMQIQKEQREGLDYTCYPPVTQNQEQYGDTPGRESKPKKTDINDNEIPDDKINPVDKKQYENAMILVNAECPYCQNVVQYDSKLEKSEKDFTRCLECGNEIFIKDLAKRKTKKKPKSYDLIGAPYTRLVELPKNVKQKLNITQQRKWMKIFNNAWNYMYKKTKDKKKADNYAFPIAWNKVDSIIEKSIETSAIDTKKLLTAVEQLFDIKSKQLLEDLREKQKLDIDKKKSKLLDNLLNKENNENI